jgi:flavin reductase (DIM6/NTAB) family NADH-FMN oxidoreductase RutF
MVRQAAPYAKPTMAISSEEFRMSLRHFPAGVTIVTVKAGEQGHGLTVSAFASVAPQPPLVMVIIENRHRGYELLESDGAVFAVNVLGENHRDLSNRFAWVKDEDRFAMGSWSTKATGAPVLADAVAWLDCTHPRPLPHRTNTIYMGEIQASGVPVDEAPPLVYWNRGYRHLDLRTPEEKKGR